MILSLKFRIATFILLFSFSFAKSQNSYSFADSIRLSYNIPEISYTVFTSDTILEIQAIGYHSIALKDTATLLDRFHIGSNTKAMTAFVIAKYVENGLLRWDTKFFDIFPYWEKNAKKEYLHITLKDLLSHRAGIQAFQGDNDPEIPLFSGTKKQKRDKFGQFVLSLEPLKIDSLHPFQYSNAGYTLATMMLEKVSHHSWEELIQQIFNKDLQLQVQFSWPENQQTKDTWGHITENGILVPVPSNTDYHIDFTEPSGDINCKLEDYIKFIQMNLNGLAGNNNYLQSTTYQYLHKGIEFYSLGWYNSYENNKSYSTHAGTAGTYYTLVAIDRIQLRAYVIFANVFNENTVQGIRLLMRKLKENYTTK